MLPRSSTIESGRSEGRDTIVKHVRAGSKMGAMLTARVDAISEIPFRAQRVNRVESMGNARFLDKWKVYIVDEQEMETVP